MTPVRVEGCVTTVAEAEAAVAAGADRIELCRDLETGGLTPRPDVLARVRTTVSVPVFTMVRPVAGPFTVNADTRTRMLHDASRCLEAGADGLVVGALRADGEVDAGLVREIVARAEGRSVTFHRAFDEAPDLLRALEQVADLGVVRVLTAGGTGTAWAGRGVLRSLVQASRGRVTIVAGGGVRADHARRLIEATGVREVHARASAVAELVTAVR